jgi:AcrR family transcriptional regulator
VSSTRERIVDAALTLIAEQGLSKVSMTDIARAAGVSRQTLYNHYPDIPSIVAEAATRHNEVAIANLEQALSVVESPADRIRQIILHVAAISLHGAHRIDSHAGLPTELEEQLRGFDHALEQHIRSALSDGVEQGEFRSDLNVETDGVLLRHALGGLSALVAGTPDAAAEIVRDASRTLLAALRTSVEA